MPLQQRLALTNERHSLRSGAKSGWSLILLTAEGRSHRQVMAKFKHSALILQQRQQRFSIQRAGLFQRQSARLNKWWFTESKPTLTSKVEKTFRSERLKNPQDLEWILDSVRPPPPPHPPSSLSLSLHLFSLPLYTHARARTHPSLASLIIFTTWPALIMTHQPGERRSQAGTVWQPSPLSPHTLATGRLTKWQGLSPGNVKITDKSGEILPLPQPISGISSLQITASTNQPDKLSLIKSESLCKQPTSSLL